VKIITHASAARGEFGEGNNLDTLVWPSLRPTRLADALFLARLIRQHRPDCLLANFAAVNWMCLTGWLYGVKHRLAFYHTLRSQTQADGPASQNGLSGLSQFRKRMVYRTATRVAGISQAALLDAQNSFGVPARKCTLWRFSMPDPAGQYVLKSAAERDDVIVCAARLAPSKGQDVLISALASGRGPLASVTVEFLGAGPALESLRQMAEDSGIAHRCRFLGHVSHGEVLVRMSRAKVTVLPSHQEAFGLVNMESMSVGTPVIASQVDGIREIIRESVDGFLVPPGDPRALAEALGRLLADQPLREQLGRNARQRFLDHYEDSVVLRKQADWLEDFVQAGGPVGKQ
jgi:glycosyltransferase involved in cell wall biosynthesis